MAGKKRKTATATAPPKARKQVTCAFCKGKGIDPFGVPSELSTCQVCLGSGKVWVEPPAITCAFCGGSGVHLDKRLTCSVCGGKGVVTEPKNASTCPDCLGTGMSSDGLPCLLCRGKGVI